MQRKRGSNLVFDAYLVHRKFVACGLNDACRMWLTSSSACSELSRLRLKLSSLATSLFSLRTVLMRAAFSLPSRCACSSDALACKNDVQLHK